MSTKIFVVLWTGFRGPGEQRIVSYTWAVKRRGKSGNWEGANEAQVGLARALSKLGYCSRKAAFALIRAGRVRLNGTMPKNPEAPVRLDKDRIEVDGVQVGRAAKEYWMLNKPRGVVTTASDEQGRETVYAALPKGLPWMGPVGRLDKASEGLLLFSNDSEWAAKITAPESHLDKTYHVQISRIAAEALCKELISGTKMPEGEVLRAKATQLLRTGEKTSWLEMKLDEGKNRQIRRMLEARGIEVVRLIRVSIGSLELGNLAKGEARPLTVSEKNLLDQDLRMSTLQRTTASVTGNHQ